MRKILYGFFILIILGGCSINNKNLNEFNKMIELIEPAKGKRIVLFNNFVYMSFSLEDILRDYKKSIKEGVISLDFLKKDSLVLPINNLLI